MSFPYYLLRTQQCLWNRDRQSVLWAISRQVIMYVFWLVLCEQHFAFRCQLFAIVIENIPHRGVGNINHLWIITTQWFISMKWPLALLIPIQPEEDDSISFFCHLLQLCCEKYLVQEKWMPSLILLPMWWTAVGFYFYFAQIALGLYSWIAFPVDAHE